MARLAASAASLAVSSAASALRGALAFLARLCRFLAQARGNCGEGSDHLAEFVAGPQDDRRVQIAADHAPGRGFQRAHGVHDGRIEAGQQVEDQQRGPRRAQQDQKHLAVVAGDVRMQHRVQFLARAVPEPEAGIPLFAALALELFRRHGDFPLPQNAPVEELQHLVRGVLELAERLVQAVADVRGVVPKHPAHDIPRRIQIGAQQAGQARELGALLGRQRRPRTEAFLAEDGRLPGEVFSFGQVQENRVHQVVAVEVRIEDQVRGVADVGREGVHVGQERRVQAVHLFGRLGGQVLLEGTPVRLDRGELARGVEFAAEFPVHRRQVLQVLIDFPLNSDPFRLAAQVVPDGVLGQQAAPNDVLAQAAEGAQILDAVDLFLRESDVVEGVGEEEIQEQPQGKGEQQADESELPGIGEAIHDGRGGRQPQGRPRPHGPGMSGKGRRHHRSPMVGCERRLARPGDVLPPW